MTESAEVILWGRRIGIIYRNAGMRFARFKYDRDFVGVGIEPSPLMMKVGFDAYEFPELPEKSFHGLPGMLSDSLPDKFGNAVLNLWLERQGMSANSLSPIERLCYTGIRGIGALEYHPMIFDKGDMVERLHVDKLSQLADAVLRSRYEAKAGISSDLINCSSIMKVGSSAGGARAKALIGWNEETGEVVSGQVKLPPEFGYWIIKFDGITGNCDKERDDEWGYGRVEYAYHLMARAAGIKMSECRLWNKRHFITRRFDRTSADGKIHTQSLGAIAHYDFNDPASYSYEQAFRITRKIVRDSKAVEELFRRMVFNVLAWNCDDHVKNIAYLMDRDGSWSLAPAYDMTFAYNPGGDWTGCHQMSVNGKRFGITDEDMLAAAVIADLRRNDAVKIIDEVRQAVHEWSRFAADAEVGDDFAKIGILLKG